MPRKFPGQRGTSAMVSQHAAPLPPSNPFTNSNSNLLKRKLERKKGEDYSSPQFCSLNSRLGATPGRAHSNRPALDQPHYDDDDRQDQENMDETSNRIGGHHSKKP